MYLVFKILWAYKQIHDDYYLRCWSWFLNKVTHGNNIQVFLWFTNNKSQVTPPNLPNQNLWTCGLGIYDFINLCRESAEWLACHALLYGPKGHSWNLFRSSCRASLLSQSWGWCPEAAAWDIREAACEVKGAAISSKETQAFIGLCHLLIVPSDAECFPSLAPKRPS